MSTEIVTSAGSLGADFNRSDGRAYLTAESVINDGNEFIPVIEQFRKEASERGRRRWVVKARCAPSAIDALYFSGLPVEARLPLLLIDSTLTDEVVMLGGNAHESEVPEWDYVYPYWVGENGNFSIMNRIQTVWDRGFALTNQVLDSDVCDLSRIWYPFGWNENTVTNFIRSYRDNRNMWFSGIVDKASQRLVAACMGERLDFAGIAWCESTEFGTAKEFRGRGLCTAAVINLHAQVLEDTLFREKDGFMPLIVAELNMAVRSDVIARHTGMTIPYVEGVSGLGSLPRQVLRRNVAILEGELTGLIGFGENCQYFRNFIVSVLPRQVAEFYYRPTILKQIEQYRLEREVR